MNVLHYDYHWGARGRVEILEHYFRQSSEINYVPVYPTSEAPVPPLSNLEQQVSTSDLFLVHPGVENQREVFRYHELFPQLPMALLIPGAYEQYDQVGDIKIINMVKRGWVDRVAEFVFSCKK